MVNIDYQAHVLKRILGCEGATVSSAQPTSKNTMAEAESPVEMQDRAQSSRHFNPRIGLTLCSNPAAADKIG